MVATWDGRSQFEYAGTIHTGTKITYGNGRIINVTASQYLALVAHFRGQVVRVTPERTNPAVGSLEAWLKENVTRTAIASYVAPILIAHGIATRTAGNRLQF